MAGCALENHPPVQNDDMIWYYAFENISEKWVESESSRGPLK